MPYEERQRHGRSGRHPPVFSWGTRAILFLALWKTAGALAAVFIGFPAQSPGGSVGIVFVLVQLVAFGVTGTVLLIAHSHDLRTAWLGGVLVVVASAFATGLYADLAHAVPFLCWLKPGYPDAFLPFFVVTFAGYFPRTRPPAHRELLLHALRRSSLALGVSLFFVNTLAGWDGRVSSNRVIHAVLRRSAPGTIYWTAIFVLIVLTMAVMFRRTRTLSPNERRRVGWFALAFITGFTPTTVAVVIMARPQWAPTIMSAPIRSALELSLASVPITTAYAVLRRRVLPVKVVIRAAIQYALARWTILGLMVLPVALFAVAAYRHRHDTVEAFIRASGASRILVLCVFVTLLVARRPLLRVIDRAFFREAYDGQLILFELSEQCRSIDDVNKLGRAVTTAIERPLGSSFVDLLVRESGGGRFVSTTGRLRDLAAESMIIEVVSDLEGAVDVNLETGQSPLRWLPRAERQWLVDGDVRLLAGVRAPDRMLTGLLALGERHSELAYEGADRTFVSAIAGAAAIALDCQSMRSAIAAGSFDESLSALAIQSNAASECPQCGRIARAGEQQCGICGIIFRPAHVPGVLLGKYRVDARVGLGATAVVYRAHDLALQRTVAIKALPSVSPEQVQRFRLEARAMAAVTHPGLAAIYAVESWGGRPLLICEFMREGTLADRLARAPLPLNEALSLGITLAHALAAIHDAGFLHRDVKPANVGFVSPRTPKLMDFGLARSALNPNVVARNSARQGAGFHDFASTHMIAGTPLYLSPEAIAGEPPTAAFDLWSLNVLLLQAITGRHPFAGGTVEETVKIISRAGYEAAGALMRNRDPRLSRYFETALSRDADRRPTTARAVARALHALGRALSRRGSWHAVLD